MNTPTPNEMPRELLAGYADGELDPAHRAIVERQLAINPAAAGELQAQRDLSPANAALWERADPPEPTEKQWTDVSRAIGAGLAAQPRGPRWRGRAWAAAGLAAAGVAAAVAWIVLSSNLTRPPQNNSAPPEVVARPHIAPEPHTMAQAQASSGDDPLSDFPMLSMATDDDVILERVPDFPSGWLPVGRHPIAGVVMLATEEELRVAAFAPSAVWPPGGPKMITAPGDAPMIYAAKLR